MFIFTEYRHMPEPNLPGEAGVDARGTLGAHLVYDPPGSQVLEAGGGSSDKETSFSRSHPPLSQKGCCSQVGSGRARCRQEREILKNPSKKLKFRLTMHNRRVDLYKSQGRGVI